MDQNLEALLHFQGPVFPEKELNEVFENIDHYVPELVRIFERTEDEWRSVFREDPKYQLHVCAVVLLAAARVKEVLPGLARFVTFSSELMGEPFYSLLLEKLPAILASLAKGDPSISCQLIEDTELDSFIRERALHSLVSMWVIDELERDWIIAYLKELYDGKLEKEADYVWDGLQLCSLLVFAKELLPQMKEAAKYCSDEPPFDIEKVSELLMGEDQEEHLDRVRHDLEFQLLTDPVDVLTDYHYYSQLDSDFINSIAYYDGYFPDAELHAIAFNIEKFIPYLLKSLRGTNEVWRELHTSEPDYRLPIYAMYLLAFAREKEAYPLIYEFCQMDAALLDDILGDLITEDLPSILASVSCGDPSLICELVENSSCNQFARSAALYALVILYAKDELDRHWLINYFKELFTSKLEREYNDVWDGLISLCAEIYADELYDLMISAYEHPGPDDQMMNIEDINIAFARTKNEALSELRNDRFMTLMEHPVLRLSEMSPVLDMEQLLTDEDFDLQDDDTQSLSDDNEDFDNEEKVLQMPIIKPPKIGRNEPCPCGSGKKYKKCCLNK